jgi:hypothetical protein
VTYDDDAHAIVLVTNPIDKGSFAGSTVTMRFALGNPEFFANACATFDARYTAFLFGNPNGPWTISIP